MKSVGETVFNSAGPTQAWSLVGDSFEADQHSVLIAITIPGSISSVLGAKRRWPQEFAESDRDRQGGRLLLKLCEKWNRPESARCPLNTLRICNLNFSSWQTEMNLSYTLE